MEKKIVKDIIKICAFIAIVNLPFLTITHLIGADIFFDSFDNPNSYQYFQSSSLNIDTIDNGYIIFQKSSHPDFSITIGDSIFYLKDEGGLMCREIYHMTDKEYTKKYYVIRFDNKIGIEPIYEYQIVGKVVNTIDDNIWNKFSLKIWDASINNLNAVALFTE